MRMQPSNITSIIKRLLPFIFILALIVPVQSAEKKTAKTKETPLLEPGDLLRVNIVREKKISGYYYIDDEGIMTFPMVGEVELAGLSEEEAESKLIIKMQTYLRDPQISLQRVSRKARSIRKAGSADKPPSLTIYAIGHFGSPGPFPVDEPKTLVQFLAIAGGPVTEQNRLRTLIRPERSDLSNVMVIRATGGTSIYNVQDLLYKGDITQNTLLGDGDTVFIREELGRKIHIFGQVNNPGSFPVSGPINILEGIVRVGGFTKYAKYRKIRVVRTTKENPQSFFVDLKKKIETGTIEHLPMLEPGDVVYIPKSILPTIREWTGLVGDLAGSSVNIRVLEAAANDELSTGARDVYTK
jgi:polysaccharide biosynthesis/export protein